MNNPYFIFSVAVDDSCFYFKSKGKDIKKHLYEIKRRVYSKSKNYEHLRTIYPNKKDFSKKAKVTVIKNNLNLTQATIELAQLNPEKKIPFCKASNYTDFIKNISKFDSKKKEEFLKQFTSNMAENGISFDSCFSPRINKLIKYNLLGDSLKVKINKIPFLMTVKKVKETNFPRIGSFYLNRQLIRLPVKYIYNYITTVNNKLSFKHKATKQLYEITFVKI
jgi:RecG-like helicase